MFVGTGLLSWAGGLAKMPALRSLYSRSSSSVVEKVVASVLQRPILCLTKCLSSSALISNDSWSEPCLRCNFGLGEHMAVVMVGEMGVDAVMGDFIEFRRAAFAAKDPVKLKMAISERRRRALLDVRI